MFFVANKNVVDVVKLTPPVQCSPSRRKVTVFALNGLGVNLC